MQPKDNAMVSLVSLTAAFIAAFSRGLISEAEMGRTLAYFCKEIRLSPDGEIKSIVLSTIGDYALHLLEKTFVGYKVPEQINDRKRFASLDYAKVIKDIPKEELYDVFCHELFEQVYAGFSFAQQAMKMMNKGDGAEALRLLFAMNNSPIFRAGMILGPIVKK